MEGVTGVYPLLGLEPNNVPPEEAVHQLMVFPVEVAVRLDVCPRHMVPGLAESKVGADGIMPTAIII